MFWKKKTSEKELIEYDNDNQRESFRLDTDESRPVFAQFGGHQVRMLNISAGGVAFEFKKGNVGEHQNIQVTLPGKQGFSFTALAEIVNITRSEVCHCTLSGLTEAMVENIHQYILHAQIEEQRKKRGKIQGHCNYKAHGHGE